MSRKRENLTVILLDSSNFYNNKLRSVNIPEFATQCDQLFS